jgi:ATP-dependent Lon protease
MEHPIQGQFAVLPIRNTVIFPGVALPLRVGRPASRHAIEQAQAQSSGQDGSWVLVIAQTRDQAEARVEDLYRVGTLCRLEKVKGDSTDGLQIIVRGVARMKVQEYVEKNEKGRVWIEARAEAWSDVHDADDATEGALLASLKGVAKEILELLPAETEGLAELIDTISDPVYLMNLCAGNLELPVATRQQILETVSVKSRALRLLELMQAQKEGLEVRTQIRQRMSNKMGKQQRDAILREQLRTIREELGEGGDDVEKAGEDYRTWIEAAAMPEATRKIALDELKRMEAIGNASPESHVIRNYLDLLCALPWSRSASVPGLGDGGGGVEGIDLVAARAQLDADHFGLEKIKKRIIQSLAVMKLKKSSRGSILLFVGPPGVGKTSLGESIARVLGREFVRVSLGGVRDDAEIRGHRRTYVGAMPGRIIQGIKRAGQNNPVMMLDEIDKMGRGYQGDPAAAMLEVLDPGQNGTFLDHYLDVTFDLSKVLFIATANSLDTIPAPLLDRMEVIELSGYTSGEKKSIALRHLLPKQLKEFGLTLDQLELSGEALSQLIQGYTREAGVRQLQRELASLCRAATEEVLAPNASLPVRVDPAKLEELLGPERFVHEAASPHAPPGVVTGLAWTPQGGEILFVESTLMPGTGRLILTGQLGEVMKESAQIALSLVRSRLSGLAGLADLDKKDIHIHVPAGAIPKDGPSAGITMLTTIASVVSGKSVDSTLAMTGEVTLRGAVTPVGGIKEKLIAAHRAGIKRVLISQRNFRDLRELPEEVRAGLDIQTVETVSDVLRQALGIEELAPASVA